MTPRLHYVRWPAHILATSAIPEEARRHLLAVGIPNSDRSSQRFAVSPSQGSGDLVIGTEYGEPIYIHSGTGYVLAVQRLDTPKPGPSAPSRTLFVNTGVQQLTASIVAYESFLQDPSVEADPAYAHSAFTALGTSLSRIDPPALLPLFGAYLCMWPQLLTDIRWQLE